MRKKPPEGRVEFAIWEWEQRLGKTLSTEERAAIEKVHKEMIQRSLEEIQHHVVTRAQATKAFMKSRAAFMRKLKARQGTITPDFDALYQTKADLDRRLLGGDDP